MLVLILKDYRSMKKQQFAVLLTNITNGLYSYTLVFITPTVIKADYTDAVTAYTEANSAFEAGGKGFKSAYTTARSAMLGILDKLHSYVLALPGLNAVVAEQSGFTVNDGGGSVSLVQPVFNKLVRMGGNAVSIEYNTVKGALFYTMLLVEAGTLPAGFVFANGVLTLPAGTNPKIYLNTTKARKKTFGNLTVGTLYNVYCFANDADGSSVLSAATDFTFSNK